MNENIGYEQYLLSFAIATYNRKEMVGALIKELLCIDREDIEVVVTDNSSTDGTLELLKGIDDSRLKLYKNETNLGAINNMVKAVFNASGKYVFYINDRDSVFIENIPELLTILSKDNYSYINAKNCANGEKLSTFQRGIDSLIHHQLCTHPTGMIFNGNILKSKYKPEDFYKYADTFYSPDFMARCCMMNEKSAVYEKMICKGPGEKFLSKIRSGANPVRDESGFHKHPVQLVKQMKETYQQIFKELVAGLNEEESCKLSLYILQYFYKEIFHYKKIKADKVLTNHYNLKLEKIGLFKMEKYISQYYYETLIFLKEEKYSQERISEWKHRKFYNSLYCIYCHFRTISMFGK